MLRISLVKQLETIFDRIHLLEHRYEILLRDAEIEYLKNCLTAERAGEPIESLTLVYQSTVEQIKSDLAFIQHVNVGGEFMDDDQIERIQSIAAQHWNNMLGQSHPVLESDEVENLCIRRGTLNDKEREVINYHIVATIKMLESLPFPKHLQRVPEYAGGHHEKMDGSGYPKGLKKEDMSVQARIMAIADIFEALTASDRPYKKGKKLSECLRIMGFMKKDSHIDPDLFEIFIKEKVYLKYAEEFLDPSQIDTIEERALAGLLN